MRCKNSRNIRLKTINKNIFKTFSKFTCTIVFDKIYGRDFNKKNNSKQSK